LAYFIHSEFPKVQLFHLTGPLFGNLIATRVRIFSLLGVLPILPLKLVDLWNKVGRFLKRGFCTKGLSWKLPKKTPFHFETHSL